MPSVIKVDQIQSDTGTVNLTSNVAFSGSASTMQIGNALYLANTNNFALQFQPDVAGRFRIASSVSSFGDNNPFLIERPTSAGIQNDAITIRSGGVVDLGKGQLKFPASQNASADANTLDDYEEGTWSPLIAVEGGSGTISPSSTLDARYTKIGRLVTLHCHAIWNNYFANGGNSAILLSNIPFAVVMSNAAENFVGLGMWESNNIVGTVTTPTLHITTTAGTSVTSLYLKYFISGTSYSYIRVNTSPLAGSSGNFSMRFSIVYQTAT